MNNYAKYLTKENIEQSKVASYMRNYYPDVLWWHTMNEGKRTPFEQYLFKLLGGKAGIPDIIIVHKTERYSGLAIELKSHLIPIYQKNGKCLHPKQEEVLQQLTKAGFKTSFAQGFEKAKTIIDEYLKEVKNEK